MIKKIIVALVCLYSLSSMAGMNIQCPMAAPTTSAAFCDSFKAVAKCHCSKSLPASMCNNMRQLHDRMVAMFGSVERACRFQQNTGAQDCIDDWHCYLNGGQNSTGALCNGTGTACPSA